MFQHTEPSLSNHSMLKLPHCISWIKTHVDVIHHIIHLSNQSVAFMYCVFLIVYGHMLVNVVFFSAIIVYPLYLFLSEWSSIRDNEVWKWTKMQQNA
jgi:hypothetical protein